MGECLAYKATSTLSKRVGSMERYLKWCADLDLHQPLRASLEQVEQFVRDLGAAATAAEGFRNALNVSLGMFGLDLGRVGQRPGLKGLCIS
eukprot:305480-Amphidinium_carterae.1